MTGNLSQPAIDLGLGLEYDISARKWLSHWLIYKTPEENPQGRILGPPLTKQPATQQQQGQAPGKAGILGSALPTRARPDPLQPRQS